MSNIKKIDYDIVNALCESTSVDAGDIANALGALVESLEVKELYGLAFILETLAERTRDLCDHISDIPLKSNGVNHG